jgi:hypothetical protein
LHLAGLHLAVGAHASHDAPGCLVGDAILAREALNDRVAAGANVILDSLAALGCAFRGVAPVYRRGQ